MPRADGASMRRVNSASSAWRDERRVARLVALALVCAIRPASAEPVRLTIDDAVRQMRERGPDAIAAALKVRAAEGGLRTARAYPNPTLSVGVQNLALGKTNPSGLSPGDTVVVQ